jgi:hypothetical protein
VRIRKLKEKNEEEKRRIRRGDEVEERSFYGLFKDAKRLWTALCRWKDD